MFLPTTITLKFGDSGDFVAELQRRLVAVNCFSDSMVNGFFDGATTNGVRTFQGMQGLSADGVAGPETLRRLNAVIAGDTSSTSGAPKDEPKEDPLLSHPPATQTFSWGAAATPAPTFGVQPREEVVEAPATAPPIEPPAFAPPVEQRPPETSLPNPLREPIPAQLNPGAQNPDMLGGMFPIASAPNAAPRPEMADRQPLPTAGQPVFGNAPAASQTAPSSEQPLVEAEPRQGLLSRTKQFANAMIQKLSDYFEAKLPPSVLNEVKEIGLSMAKQGVRELPIPSTPQPVREQDLPTRQPEPIRER